MVVAGSCRRVVVVHGRGCGWLLGARGGDRYPSYVVTTSPMATWPLFFMWTKERGRKLLTSNHVDSDGDMRRHCLDDVARLLTCQVVCTI